MSACFQMSGNEQVENNLFNNSENDGATSTAHSFETHEVVDLTQGHLNSLLEKHCNLICSINIIIVFLNHN